MTKPVSYLQTDPRWKNHNYSAPGEQKTIGAAGCGVTCAAMVLATLANKAITPVTTAEWSMGHGYKALNQGTYYSYFAPQGKAYGLEWDKVNPSNLRDMKVSQARPYHEQALAAIKAGHYVICCMGPGNWTSGGHYILWYGVDGDNVLINDPASTRAVKLKAPLTTLQNEVKYYFICRVPKAAAVTSEPEEDEEVKRYEHVYDIPNEYGFRTVIDNLMTAGIINGDGSDAKGNGDRIDLSEEQVRTFVILYRGGAFDRKLHTAGIEPAVK